jgi:hypothetical protein
VRFSDDGMPNTSSFSSFSYVAYSLYLRDRRISLHIAALCARYSFHLTGTATVRKSVPHGCGHDNPKYTSPTVLKLKKILTRKSSGGHQAKRRKEKKT